MSMWDWHCEGCGEVYKPHPDPSTEAEAKLCPKCLEEPMSENDNHPLTLGTYDDSGAPLPPMIVYHGFHVYDNQDGASIEVDTEPAKLLVRLSECLNSTRGSKGRIETLEVGRVEAVNVEEAINSVRRGDWIQDDTYGYAHGAKHKS